MVRAPQRGDISDISLLVGRCDETCAGWAPFGWQPPPRVAIEARWRQRLARTDAWARVAIEDGEIIGAVAAERAELCALYVDPEHWCRGIGGTFLHCAERAMQERGVAEAVLWTPERSPARRFYERRGWSADGRRAESALLAMTVVAYAKRLGSAAPAEAVRAGQDRAQVGDV